MKLLAQRVQRKHVDGFPLPKDAQVLEVSAEVSGDFTLVILIPDTGHEMETAQLLFHTLGTSDIPSDAEYVGAFYYPETRYRYYAFIRRLAG